MKILFTASESLPFIKTGGLGDVAYALPKALADAGHEVKVIIPFYGRVKHGEALSPGISTLSAKQNPSRLEKPVYRHFPLRKRREQSRVLVHRQRVLFLPFGRICDIRRLR